jgi:1,2-diacylglycerol-3-alpha-glucose alpha-1,2-galactosyltransferase
MMKIHVISSTEFMVQGTGVHSAFRSMVDLLNEHNDVEVVVNEEGSGDVFHSHSYGLYFFLKSLKYKGRRIHTVHTTPDTLKGSIMFASLIQPFSNLYFKLVFNHVDVCIAISPMVEQRLKSWGVKSRIVRINNPVALEKWQPKPESKARGRAMMGLKKDDFVVLGVGQLQKRKGVEDFLTLCRKHPNMQFVWAGGKPFGPLTEGFSQADDLPANLKFLGMVDLATMPTIYAAADVLLFPSYQENSPLVPIEAAASGLPVVFRNLKEYEMLYETEYLKAQNIDEFSNVLTRLYVDDDFRQEAIAMSKNLVKQFDKEVIRAKLLSLYNEVYNGPLQRKPIFAMKSKRSLLRPVEHS